MSKSIKKPPTCLDFLPESFLNPILAPKVPETNPKKIAYIIPPFHTLAMLCDPELAIARAKANWHHDACPLRLPCGS